MMVVVVLVACTPVGPAASEAASAAASEPGPALVQAHAPSEPDPAPAVGAAAPQLSCSHREPDLAAPGDAPWLWHARPDRRDHPCRFGCVATGARPSIEAGLSVSLEPDHDVVIESTAPAPWSRTQAADGHAPTEVRWISGCAQTVVLAAYDAETIRVVALARDTGEEIDRYEERLPPSTSDFAVQLGCSGGLTAVYTRSREQAWSLTMPRASKDDGPRALPHEVVVALRDPAVAGRLGSSLARARTPDRQYRGTADRLSAFDREGKPLWLHRATSGQFGCLADGQELTLRGCSRCPPAPTVAIDRIGAYVGHRVSFVVASMDVLDADGHHVAHILYE